MLQFYQICVAYLNMEFCGSHRAAYEKLIEDASFVYHKGLTLLNPLRYNSTNDRLIDIAAGEGGGHKTSSFMPSPLHNCQIQQLLALFPVWHESRKKRVELDRVIGVDKVTEFMQHDIFNAASWRTDEPSI